MQNEDCRLFKHLCYQLHTLLSSRSTLHICQKFQWTSKQLKSAYLDFQYFHRRSSKISCRISFFVVGMIFSLLYLHNSFCTVQWILGQQLLFKRKHRSLVPIHSHVHRKLRSLTWGLSDRKKGSSLRLCCFWVVDDVPGKKGMDL